MDKFRRFGKRIDEEFRSCEALTVRDFGKQVDEKLARGSSCFGRCSARDGKADGAVSAKSIEKLTEAPDAEARNAARFESAEERNLVKTLITRVSCESLKGTGCL